MPLETHFEPEITQLMEFALEEDFDRDPIGSAFILYAGIRNGYSSARFDLLVDWAQHWTEKVLINQQVSRAKDKEIASAAFCMYALSAHSKVDLARYAEPVQNFLDPLFEDEEGFFGNFAYTCLIGLYLRHAKNAPRLHEKVSRHIAQKVNSERQVFNDPLNLLAWSIFSCEMQNAEPARRIVDYCVRQLENKARPQSDRLYLAYVGWLARRFASSQRRELFKNVGISGIRNYVAQLLANSGGSLPELENRGIGVGSGRLSRIGIAVVYDFANQLRPETVVLLREKLEKPSLFLRIGGITASVLLIGLVFWGWGILFRFTTAVNISGLKSQLAQQFLWVNFGTLVVSLLVVLIGVIITSVALVLTGSVIYNVVVKSIPVDEIVWQAFARHLRSSLLWGTIVGAGFTLLLVLFS